MAIWVKICGITTVQDAELAAGAGADAIGLNVVPTSKRRVEPAVAQAIANQLRGSVEVVLVVADMPRGELERLRREVGCDWVQFHGSEPASAIEPFLPRAYKALRIRDASDVAKADSFPGERLLVDSKVPGELGGTGTPFDHSLVENLARRRSLIVAGGLDASNVRSVVTRLQPFGVDTASGVELPGAPGRKDPDSVRAFLREAKGQA